MEITSYSRRKVLEDPNAPEITKETCESVVANPEHVEVEANGRTRYWGKPEGRELYLRVVVTADGTALHNAFFDSNFTRKRRREQG